MKCGCEHCPPIIFIVQRLPYASRFILVHGVCEVVDVATVSRRRAPIGIKMDTKETRILDW